MDENFDGTPLDVDDDNDKTTQTFTGEYGTSKLDKMREMIEGSDS